MEKVKSCCFTGNRPQGLPWRYDESDERCKRLKDKLQKAVMDLIEKDGVTHFISGMALGVDMYAAEIILSQKETYPQITLECALPCITQTVKWASDQQKRYDEIIERADKATMLQTEYTPDCMNKRNQYMVDHSEFVIAVWNGKPGGTGNTIRYAGQKEKTVIQIDPLNI